MGFIMCPECGAKISEKAKVCPYCGFQGEDASCPIALQKDYEAAPLFKYEIEDVEFSNNGFSMITYEDNKTLYDALGKWDSIKNSFPALAGVIMSFAEKEHVMIAKIPEYIKKKIDSGEFKLVFDKNGEILPTITGPDGFVKQVRLEDAAFSPNMLGTVNNLTTQASMARILDEIKNLGQSIADIHIELQNDRLALAESARDQLHLALSIQDSKLREQALLNVVGSACNAKRTLMRNFAQNRSDISKNSNKSLLKLFFEKSNKGINAKAVDAMQDLVFITSAVRTECEGFGALGEYEACKQSLTMFKNFIVDNKLDDNDTILMLNETAENKQNDIIDSLKMIPQRIMMLDPMNLPEGKNAAQLLTTETTKEIITNE